ncbi:MULTISPECIES: HlyD family secretion protein [Bosea]|uniref:HlyD family secretion protein n=1 Tax=Bosea TaxID=85413 RepID=UPI00214F928F|nr:MULTISPECIES: HlyD family secretion protein [Bosea]MCR4521536.1 HlyD family secretion protein [Bosea sp. 47.2.35]MDR6829281.1 membrane fusion protein (multidrug efflux system) [Bosea robiniae]MDR6896204.1 membrane fusion protein (multidrug efflux system) [Bosea sp. BE109]MDR7139562.1 membrane fusion protein (multidrug efflux system) [Bosea sp. BE168]MDR7176299.1 membrane fusion protein (multidrug efflux system) [Bosea sp. BE271]
MSAETATEHRRDRLKLVDAKAETAQPAAEPATARDAQAKSAPPETAETRAKSGKSPLKRGALLVVGAAVIGAGLWYGVDWWRNGRFIVSTDDAYVGAEMATISAKLSANIATVSVRQNQEVRAGQPLVALDDGDWRIALDSARAKSATAQATLARIDSQVEAARAAQMQAQAQQNSAEAAVTRTAADFDRANSLAAKSYGSQATLDAATAARDQAVAAVASAKAGVVQAQANIKVLEAQRIEAARQIDELKVAEQKAERDLSFMKIAAPIDGVIANTNVQIGDLVGAGKRLMSIVPLDQVYVDANFKETQVGPLKTGDKASITVDALPGQVFHGTVSGIAGGTGSVFTLLPPDNATGNFTKIVQRVPVRIMLDKDAAAKHVLRPGMSVVVSIDPRPAGQR